MSSSPRVPYGTDFIDPRIYQQKITEPELQFAALWAQLYPEVDLYFQYPLEGYPRSRWDFAHLESKTGIEIQGGLYQANSGHRSHGGVSADITKQQRAASAGWAYLPIASADVIDPLKLAEIKQLIDLRTREK